MKKKHIAVSVIFGAISAVLLIVLAAMLLPFFKDLFGTESLIEGLFGAGSYRAVALIAGVLFLISVLITIGVSAAARRYSSESSDEPFSSDSDVYRRNALEELKSAGNIMAEIEALSKRTEENDVSGDEQTKLFGH